MLRGWMKLHRPNVLTVPVLALAMAAGVCLSKSVAEATPMTAYSFSQAVDGYALRIETLPFPAVLSLRASGQVSVQSALGNFEGRWTGIGETLCFFFEQGPRPGSHCVTVFQRADGSFETSDGEHLSPVARVLRF